MENTKELWNKCVIVMQSEPQKYSNDESNNDCLLHIKYILYNWGAWTENENIVILPHHTINPAKSAM